MYYILKCMCHILTKALNTHNYTLTVLLINKQTNKLKVIWILTCGMFPGVRLCLFMSSCWMYKVIAVSGVSDTGRTLKISKNIVWINIIVVLLYILYLCCRSERGQLFNKNSRNSYIHLFVCLFRLNINLRESG